ncbi:MAG: hypothetical protein HOP29_14985 [Phycisphaerales bacterium]|nr:hypothetical protein [Phycisphaerales bacterium]
MRTFGTLGLFVVVQSLWSSQATAQGDIRLLWSSPPDGYVDLSQARSGLGLEQGIRTVLLAFSEDVPLSADDIELVGASEDHSVATVVGSGRLWAIQLSRPIPHGKSIILAILGGQFVLTIHSRPGDINLDGFVDDSDSAMLLSVLSLSAAYDDRFDINRDNVIDSRDVASISKMQTGYDENQNSQQYDARLHAACCCDGMNCIVVGSDCPSGSSQASECPCTGNSCVSEYIIPDP